MQERLKEKLLSKIYILVLIVGLYLLSILGLSKILSLSDEDLLNALLYKDTLASLIYCFKVNLGSFIFIPLFMSYIKMIVLESKKQKYKLKDLFFYIKRPITTIIIVFLYYILLSLLFYLFGKSYIHIFTLFSNNIDEYKWLNFVCLPYLLIFTSFFNYILMSYIINSNESLLFYILDSIFRKNKLLVLNGYGIMLIILLRYTILLFLTMNEALLIIIFTSIFSVILYSYITNYYFDKE